MKPKGNIYQVVNYSVDLFRIKTIKIGKRYTTDKEDRLVEIIYNDRLEYIYNPLEKQTELKTINDTIEVYFPDGKTALSELNQLEKAWEDYLSRL